MTGWMFLTNHAHVLLAIARDNRSTAKEIATRVGITERAVQRILDDLEAGGYMRRFRDGRRNRYEIDVDRPMRHAAHSDIPVRKLLALLATPES